MKSTEAPSSTPILELDFGIRFEDLYQTSGLEKIDKHFVVFLREQDQNLSEELEKYRELSSEKDKVAYSDSIHNESVKKETKTLDPLPTKPLRQLEAALLLKLAPALESFIIKLFGIQKSHEILRTEHSDLMDLYKVKWKFVKRKALLEVTENFFCNFEPEHARKDLEQSIADGPFEEGKLAKAILKWQQEVSTNKKIFAPQENGISIRPCQAEKNLELAKQYCAWAAGTNAGKLMNRNTVLFKFPEEISEGMHAPKLVLGNKTLYSAKNQKAFNARKTIPIWKIDPLFQRKRVGFNLNDPGTTLPQALDEAHYCLNCHKKSIDSCSNYTKKSSEGCPLGERISEFLELKKNQYIISSLAMIVVENPMVAATGHRICNDCSRGCIYQNQTPVDIPLAETQTLKDVLNLPWGFEIYSLLTRWNPLNLLRPYPKKNSGYNILIAGMGPAGFTLAHHLINEGHAVLGIDCLKIEPMESLLNGINSEGTQSEFVPIHDINQLYEPLEKRTPMGFGGVAEYGITARWNKNYLTVIRLLLERRNNFCLIGGVRLGSNLTAKQAFEMGFDHVVLATGARPPTPLNLPNSLGKGVRIANDFLMTLQLTGIIRKESLANLQIRMPIVVIGGGLTAIDTATEALAYYPLQVERFLHRHEVLSAKGLWPPVEQTEEELLIEQEFITHAKAIRAQKIAGKPIQKLLEKWGGATVVYRKSLIDSPAYRLNPEELTKALEEGICFAENLSPKEIHLDQYGALTSVEFTKNTLTSSTASNSQTSHFKRSLATVFSAKSLFIAIGSSPAMIAVQAQSSTNESLLGSGVSVDQEMQHDQSDAKYSQKNNNFDSKKTHFFGTQTTILPNSAANSLFQEYLGADLDITIGSEEDLSEIILGRTQDGRKLSFIGDANPKWAGSVVRAMASAQTAFPKIGQLLIAQKPASPFQSFEDFRKTLNKNLRAQITKITRLSPNIISLSVKSPQSVQNCHAGQFFRLQNFEKKETIEDQDPPEKSVLIQQKNPTLLDSTTDSIPSSHINLNLESLVLTAANINKKNNEVEMVILENGCSSLLCQTLQPGPIILMGPSGSPSERNISPGETVVLVGGGVGNASLCPIGKFYKERGAKVLHFAGYKNKIDRTQAHNIEKNSHTVVWCCDQYPGFLQPNRSQDLVFYGDVIKGIEWYACQKYENFNKYPKVQEATYLLVIGSQKLMAALANALKEKLAQYFPSNILGMASVNAPMQCAAKGICAQCLIPQTEPATGITRYVFSCIHQDQPLNWIDFDTLNARLSLNSLLEKQSLAWLRGLLGKRIS